MQIKQTAQQIAKTVAKQTLDESNEFLKSAREQITPNPEAQQPQNQQNNDKPKEEENPFNRPKNLSFLNEYKSELDQIRRDNLFKELQQKISEGEEIPLENYTKELGYEQREVLKAQMEAMKIRKEASVVQQKPSFGEVVSKKGRQMFSKIKKRNEQHVETRQPPSS